MKKEIWFPWGFEKRIRVAEAGERSALFYEAYRQALAGVVEIVRASITYEHGDSFDPLISGRQTSGSGGDRPELYSICDQEYLYDYPNNLIVFSGERGAGKSSAMLTFVKSLENKQGRLFGDEFLADMVNCELHGLNCKTVSTMLQKCEFDSLPPIDPTALEDNGQILTVILSRMFHMANNTWEKEHDRLERGADNQRLNKKNELIQQFSTCYEHILAIKRARELKPENEGLDTLAELGDSSLLKSELSKLVKQLLQFRRPDAGDSSYLVLQIDDTDMNIKQAYAILEDIRRYLVIPRLIIVMAADLKHLTQVVGSSLLKDYDKDLPSRQEYVDKITRQYITKLFPQTRQINLPSLGTYFKEHTDNITIHNTTPSSPFQPDREKEFPDAQEHIFRLIYRKTGVVFLKQENKLHPIIPGNMRLLAHLLSMLVQMGDVEDPNADTPGFFLCKEDANHTLQDHRRKLHMRLENVQRFRNYFLTAWTANALEDQWVQFFNGLEQIDIEDRARYICIRLHEIRALLDSEAGGGAKPFPKTYTGRGCYVDMAALCGYISHRSGDENMRRLIFAIRTYFSLLAHEVALEDLVDYYDECQGIEQPLQGLGENQDDGGSQYDKPTGLGCAFSKLHLLFGSHIFPYHNTYNDERVFTEIRLAGSDPTPQKMQLMDMCWPAKERGSISYLRMLPKQFAVLLFSLLAEYQDRDGEDEYWMDVTSPIINCLYLGDQAGLTPFTKTIHGSEPLLVASIGWMPWHQMGNSALLTVLNSDVWLRASEVIQNEVNSTARRISGIPRYMIKYYQEIEYSTWIRGIKDLYTKMAKAVSPAKPSAVRCLDHIRYDGWLDAVDTLTVESWADPEAKEDWYTFVHKVNKNIFRQESLEKKLENPEEENSPKDKPDGDTPAADTPPAAPDTDGGLNDIGHQE